MADRPREQLSDAQWKRVEALFPEVVVLPVRGQRRFLAYRCADDGAVRVELESLLASSAGASWLDGMVALRAADAQPAPGSLAANTRLGVWRVECLLGRGGMGEVYRAGRAEGGFVQTAAVKLLRVDAGEHAARFEAERSILAQLEHPNIARLLDGGIDAAGRAWMAMEYVAGKPLDAWCREHRCGVDARLALFDQVCAAVAYAHAHLVVHSDLKPANVLVTADGRVKLVDFGVAKLLALGAETNVTQTMPPPLTPAHAAPEQLEGRAITTATDIYALGVLLYELLCGRRPWVECEGLLAGVVQRVARGEPVAPSVSAATDSPVPAARLRGDLDAIVMRCLRHKPADRYPGVVALRDDLQRRARHEPVLARRGARGYVLRRWIRRHRLGVAATSTVALALVVGLAATLWQARRAERQAWRTELVKSLVLSAFREGDPLSRPGADARSPAQLVADAVDAAGYRFRDEPLLRAEVLGDLGEVQASLGDPAGGRASLEKALALRRSKGVRTDDLETAVLLRKLAVVLLRGSGNHDLALSRANEAQAMLTRLRLGESADMARAELISALVLETRRERERALQLTVGAQRKLEAALGRDDPETATAVFRRGQVLDQLRRDEEAATALRDAVARMERATGPDSARLVQPLTALGGVLMRAHPEEAIAVYERAAAIAEAKLGPRNPTRARLLNRMANAFRMRGNTQRAEAIFVQALAALPADDSVELSQLLASRGQLYLDTQRPAEAAADLQRAFQMRRAKLGDGDGITWYTESLWGRALRVLGRLDDAERVQREALARLQRILGKDAYQNVLLIDALTETLTARGQHAEAIVLARRSLALTRESYPPTHMLVADRSVRLATALGAAGGAARRSEAAGLCRTALDVYAGLKAHDTLSARAQVRCAPLLASDG